MAKGKAKNNFGLDSLMDARLATKAEADPIVAVTAYLRDAARKALNEQTGPRAQRVAFVKRVTNLIGDKDHAGLLDPATIEGRKVLAISLDKLIPAIGKEYGLLDAGNLGSDVYDAHQKIATAYDAAYDEKDAAIATPATPEPEVVVGSKPPRTPQKVVKPVVPGAPSGVDLAFGPKAASAESAVLAPGEMDDVVTAMAGGRARLGARRGVAKASLALRGRSTGELPIDAFGPALNAQNDIMARQAIAQVEAQRNAAAQAAIAGGSIPAGLPAAEETVAAGIAGTVAPRAAAVEGAGAKFVKTWNGARGAGWLGQTAAELRGASMAAMVGGKRVMQGGGIKGFLGREAAGFAGASGFGKVMKGASWLGTAMIAKDIAEAGMSLVGEALPDRQEPDIRQGMKFAAQQAQMQRQIQDIVERRNRLLQDKDPNLLNVLRGLPELAPGEVIVNAKPDDDSLRAFHVLDALRSGELTMPTTGG